MSDRMLRRALNVLEQFRKVDPELPTQMASTFLVVALNEGCTIRDVEDKLGVSISSASRNVNALSSRPNKLRQGAEGFGLIEYRIDPKDFRRKELHLTRRGKKLMEDLVGVVGE